MATFTFYSALIIVLSALLPKNYKATQMGKVSRGECPKAVAGWLSVSQYTRILVYLSSSIC